MLSSSNPMIENSGLTDIHKQIYGYRESLISAIDMFRKKNCIIIIKLCEYDFTNVQLKKKRELSFQKSLFVREIRRITLIEDITLFKDSL